MLQVKDLVKKYTTKGETVVALDGITVDFPERGMVFLIGKSGSGKSTLLNISGGLDAPDAGEVIVKGKSSKDFSKSDFDSYRNTYVGFIFQEYNILNELTVAENVALALELQGKPRAPQRVEELLEEVDLKGYGSRRPNTLSGGQRQRVAIARALVKNPEIIMADEPTGALDSVTGAQVFDTLKKLSKEKLVVVVSHDREFAERYGDRIIELKDGKIIGDISRGEGGAAQGNLSELSEKKLTVSCGAALTDGEAEKIVAFLKKNKGSVVISSEEEDVASVPSSAAGGQFVPTGGAVRPPEENTATFIKSKFPFRYAVKMGLSGLKFKPVRLAFTILLSTIAFIIFGFFSTLVTFDTGAIGAVVLRDSAYTACVLTKDGVVSVSRPAEYGGYSELYYEANFLPEEVASLQKKYPEMGFVPVFTLGQDYLSFASCMLRTTAADSPFLQVPYYDAFYYKGFTGFTDASAIDSCETLTLIAGKMPARWDEVVVSETVYELFAAYGYDTEVAEDQLIESFEDLLGRRLRIHLGLVSGADCDVYISGIVRTNEPFATRAAYLETYGEDAELELDEIFSLSFASLCYVHGDFYEHMRPQDEADKNYRNIFVENSGAIPWAKSNYKEESASSDRYQYLFSSAGADRAKRCSTLMEELYRKTDTEQGFRYDAPYSFMDNVHNAKRLVDRMFTTLGLIAAALAAFSALLLFNFISASITAKKKDIGILRAVGARGVDVFKIFIVEAAAITLFCFALGALGAYLTSLVVNAEMIKAGVVPFPLFLFGVSNVLFVFAIALVTALFATSVPVALAAKKKPVEAIRSI